MSTEVAHWPRCWSKLSASSSAESMVKLKAATVPPAKNDAARGQCCRRIWWYFGRLESLRLQTVGFALVLLRVGGRNGLEIHRHMRFSSKAFTLSIPWSLQVDSLRNDILPPQRSRHDEPFLCCRPSFPYLTQQFHGDLLPEAPRFETVETRIKTVKRHDLTVVRKFRIQPFAQLWIFLPRSGQRFDFLRCCVMSASHLGITVSECRSTATP